MRKCKPDMLDFSAMRGRHLLIAISGGADSVALAYLLHEAMRDFDLKLSCAHVDHAIREDSASDAAYCREICQRLDIPLYHTRIDIPGIAAKTGEGLETVARRERYAWLRQVKSDIGADFIVLAHHADDQAETVLMHLFRGAGPEGITGIKSVSSDLYRPLLNIRKRDLVDYLIAKGISWHEDSTNQMDDTPRNALRLNVIPLIEQSYPRAVPAMVRYADSAQIEDSFIARLANAYANENIVLGPFGTLLKLPEGWEEAVVRRVVRKICGSDLDWEQLNRIISICKSPRGRTEISGSLYAERGRTGIYFLPKAIKQIPETPLIPDGITRIEGFCSIHALPWKAIPIKDNPYAQVLDLGALKGAVVRTRREGDRIRPLGCGEKLLSDYFTDKKTDRPLRDSIPLIAVGKNILWAVGIGISQDAAIRPDSQSCVLLRCENDFNINQ